MITLRIILTVNFCIAFSSSETKISTSEGAAARLTIELSQLNTLITKYGNEIDHVLETMVEKWDNMTNEGEFMKDNIEEFMSNPLNQLHLMRRYRTDWLEIEKELNAVSVKKSQFQLSVSNFELYYQSFKKFLVILVDVYDLDVEALSRGRIGNDTAAEIMDADDCVDIADYAVLSGCYDQCFSWLLEALTRIEKGEDCTKSVTYIAAYANICLDKEDDPFYTESYKTQCRELSTNISPVEIYLQCYVKKRKDQQMASYPIKVEPLSSIDNIVIIHELIPKSLVDSMVEEMHEVMLESNASVRASAEARVTSKYTKIAKDWLIDVDGLAVNEIFSIEIIHQSREYYTTPSSYYDLTKTRYHDFVLSLSDIDRGGAMVIDYPSITVIPEKGSALIWPAYIQVSQCPVLLGDMWQAKLVRPFVDYSKDYEIGNYWL